MSLDTLMQLQTRRELTLNDMRLNLDAPAIANIIKSKKRNESLKPLIREYAQSNMFNPIPFRNFFMSQGIYDLRDITKKRKGNLTPYLSIQAGIQSLLGFENTTTTGKNERAWYIAKGVFEGELVRLGAEFASELIQEIFNGVRSPAYDYFDSQVVKESAEENRAYIIETGILRAHLAEKGILTTADTAQLDINGKPTYYHRKISYKLGRISGLWNGEKTGPKERDALVNSGILLS